MDVAELYGLPLDRFVAERAALAKALRGDKRRDDAAAVAALRKPSIAAWVVNQLVRARAEQVRALFAAGDGLRDAQADLLAGRGGGRALRGAGERERIAVEELVRSARGLLSADGHEPSDAVLDRVADTLHAAALDDDAREQVRHGRLERELRHAGIGLGSGESTVATPAPRASKQGGRPSALAGRGDSAPDASSRVSQAGAAARDRGATVERSEAAGAEAGEAEGERAQTERAESQRRAAERAAAEHLARERAAARAARDAARRDAAAAAKALRAAEERRARAEQSLREAEDTLLAARDEATAADCALERGQAALDALS